MNCSLMVARSLHPHFPVLLKNQDWCNENKTPFEPLQSVLLVSQATPKASVWMGKNVRCNEKAESF